MATGEAASGRMANYLLVDICFDMVCLRSPRTGKYLAMTCIDQP